MDKDLFDMYVKFTEEKLSLIDERLQRIESQVQDLGQFKLKIITISSVIVFIFQMAIMVLEHGGKIWVK